ncbi:MAG: AI-2E family transporter [Gemmatimonadota bacterium]
MSSEGSAHGRREALPSQGVPLGGAVPAEPSPDLGKLLAFMRGPIDVRSLAISGLLALAVLYSVYVAREVLMPITLAFLLSFMLAPAVAALRRLGLPQGLAAGVLLLTLLLACGYGVVRLSAPTMEWLGRAPESLSEVERRLRTVTQRMERLAEATETVEELTHPGNDAQPRVQVSPQPGLGARIYSGTRAAMVGGTITLVLVYFLLASGDLFLRKLVRVLPRLGDKRRAVEIARATQSHVSYYLFTISLINLGLAVVQTLAMWALVVPNPLLWGVMAGFLNYIPYVGPILGTTVVSFVGLFSFDALSKALLVPAAYLGISIVEGNFVTPVLLGRTLTLNPVVIFIWVLFWSWLWGIVGALVAVPLLATVKIVCDHSEVLSPIGEFLGQ